MFMFLILIGAVLAAALTYPLWLFATSFPTAFSFIVSALILLLFAFLCARQVKKHGVKSLGRFLVKFLIAAAGLFGSFVLVLSGMRLFALITLFAATALFVIAAKKLRPKINELASEK